LVKENPNPSRAANVSSCCILARRRAFRSFSRAILLAVVKTRKRESNKCCSCVCHTFPPKVPVFECQKA
jgi:hypothetical protein